MWCLTLKEMDYGGEWFVKQVYGINYVKILRKIHKERVFDYDVYELEAAMDVPKSEKL